MSNMELVLDMLAETSSTEISKGTNPNGFNESKNTVIQGGEIAKMAKEVKPSKRGELEITTLNDMYLQEGRLKAELLGEGFNWFDAGTHDSLVDTADTVKTIEINNGKIISCLEQIGYSNGWLSKEKLIERGNLMSKNRYGQYLIKYAESGKVNKID